MFVGAVLNTGTLSSTDATNSQTFGNVKEVVPVTANQERYKMFRLQNIAV